MTITDMLLGALVAIFTGWLLRDMARMRRLSRLASLRGNNPELYNQAWPRRWFRPYPAAASDDLTVGQVQAEEARQERARQYAKAAGWDVKLDWPITRGRDGSNLL